MRSRGLREEGRGVEEEERELEVEGLGSCARNCGMYRCPTVEVGIIFVEQRRRACDRSSERNGEENAPAFPSRDGFTSFA